MEIHCRQSKMSSKLPSVLSATDEEIQLLLAAHCHIGTKNCEKQMEPYVWKRRADGVLSTLFCVTVLISDVRLQVSISSTLAKHGRSLFSPHV